MNSLSILHIYLKIFEVFFVVVVWHNIKGGKTCPDIEQIPSVKREELGQGLHLAARFNGLAGHFLKSCQELEAHGVDLFCLSHPCQCG